MGSWQRGWREGNFSGAKSLRSETCVAGGIWKRGTVPGLKTDLSK